MKDLKVISVLTLVAISILVFGLKNNPISLKTGDISFISMTSINNDGFKIKTFVDLSPGTKIHFTDSEWDGNHFGFDENDILWNTGTDTIMSNSVIVFTNLNAIPSVSTGQIYGLMKISKEKDAIFAYTGYERMPTKILAACSNNQLSFGTLRNTGLTKNSTAVVFE